jgi:hypothetical protein
MFTETHVIISYVLAGLGCIAYSATRYRRRARIAWGLMLLPCLQIVILYSWFLIEKIPLVDRAQPARVVLIAVGLQIAVIGFTLAYRDWKNVRRG